MAAAAAVSVSNSWSQLVAYNLSNTNTATHQTADNNNNNNNNELHWTLVTNQYNLTNINTTTGSDNDNIEIFSNPTKIVLSILLASLIVGIVIGNLLVITSVAFFNKMRTLSNGLIASLASADLLVAIAVLPISLQYEMTGRWTLGSHICELWITSDVFCCTASILNIVVIALDRYWLITCNVRYTHSTILPRRTVCVLMLTSAWLVSALIASSPLLGWRTGTERDDPNVCLISQDYGYTVFSTFGAFWFPLSVILVVYARIFCFARLRALRRQQKSHDARSCVTTATNNELARRPGGCRPAVTSRRSDSPSPPESTMAGDQLTTSNSIAAATTADSNADCRATPNVAMSRARKRRLRRIRRSARTLGLIIGGFVFCWMPFFVVATVAPFCPTCQVPPVVASLVLWLGYSNSLFNPAIYAIWDQTFRRSFKRIITCSMR